MSRSILLRLVLPAVLAATLFSVAAVAQSQDTESVAEAARRAREQKKTAAKPVKVFTDDDIKPRAPASSESAPAQASSAAGVSSDASAPANSATPGTKDERAAKELAEVKAMIKEAQSEVDLLQRKQSLEQDSFFSSPDYSRDSAGKAKLDALKQQVSDKQVDLEKLKARLLDLQAATDATATTPPKP